MDDLTATPQIRDDELDLLACCLTGWDPADVDITGAEFDDPRHEETWQAMLSIANSGGTIDPASVRLALGPNGDKAASWLLEVYARPVAPANAPAFAQRVRHAAQLRGLIDMARGLMAEATKPDANPSTLREAARSKLEQTTTITRLSETLGEILPRVIDQAESGRQPGLATPWVELDRKIHGLAPGQVTIVAARPGVGKSLFAQNVAWHWANHHELPVFFASLEMASEELGRRTVAQVAKVQLTSLQSAALNEGDWDRVGSAMPTMTKAPIHICADPTQTLDTIRSGARDVQRRRGLGLLVVDYLQLVTPRSNRTPREQQVSEVSRGLKVIAKELQVPVVALSQIRRLNDGEKNRRPGLSDLRESGAIEQDADNVLILHIPDDEGAPWDAELLVAKARHGERGSVPLLLRTHYATIQQAERRSA